MTATVAQIAHITDDLFEHAREGVIAHVVNDQGGWGAGFSGTLSRTYPEAERSYRAWFAQREYPPFLGACHMAPLGPGLTVAHLLAQRGYRDAGNPQPLDYDALRRALAALARSGTPEPIHLPRIGAGLGGGDWATIEAIIADELAGFDVRVYTLPAKPAPRKAPFHACTIESPDHGTRLYTNLDDAYADIARARAKRDTLLVGLVGSRDLAQIIDLTPPFDPETADELRARIAMDTVHEAVQRLCNLHGKPPSSVVIVSGGARGMDRIAERYAYWQRLPLIVFPADWDREPKQAGFIRNSYIVKPCGPDAPGLDELVAWPRRNKHQEPDGGTSHTIRLARENLVPVTLLGHLR